ncbi:hypothetical protein PG988_004676 [Apiospora saccharicola]
MLDIQDRDKHLVRISEADDVFLDRVSEELRFDSEQTDVLAICYRRLIEDSKTLAAFLGSEVAEIAISKASSANRKIVDICKPYLEGFVDLWIRRVEQCILEFPEAVYSESPQKQIEETLGRIISFDADVLNPVIKSVNDIAYSRKHIKPPIPETEGLKGQHNAPLPASAQTPSAHASVTQPAEPAVRKELSEGRIENKTDQDQSYVAEEGEGEREGRLKRRRIWNHLTISRDQTSATDFAREFLAKIFGISVKSRDHGDERLGPGQAPDASFDLQNTHRIAVHTQQAHAYQQYTANQQQLLGQQRLRLHRLSKDCPDSISQIPTELGSDSSQTLLNKMDSIKPGKEMPASMESNRIETESSNKFAAIPDDHNSSQDIIEVESKCDNLLDRIALLEQENQSLKRNKVRPMAPATMGYLDEPIWVRGPSGNAVLRCNLPITDIEGYLRKRSDITFVVAYHYIPTLQETEEARLILANKGQPQPVPSSEFATLHDKDMIAAMEEFLAAQADFSDFFPGLNIQGQMPAPYLFWYHYRSSNALDRLSPKSREYMEFFTSWIEENYAPKYALVKDHMEKGIVSQETMPFLVKPGDVLVWEERRQIHAAIAKGWLIRTSAPNVRQANKGKALNWSRAGSSSNKVSSKWSTPIEIDLNLDEGDEESSIDKLSKYPLRFASPRIKSCLEKRGKTFWKCRNQYLVSYEGDGVEYTNGDRFMIDYKMYQQLHSSSVTFMSRLPRPNRSEDEPERLGSEVMENDSPPPSPDIYVFPDTIPGYNIHTKKWGMRFVYPPYFPNESRGADSDYTIVDLKVDLIKDVTWNKESFKHLVVESNTKELIQALVKHQIASEQGTDIVNRKGNGLIILLHGGPGTGKTFTAESVAEMAEKPPIQEKYLDSVLYLGKMWNCILLIDEAEVFLEQRSLDNLERNALVSVFLRVLEYYEGILILTSNRVGTFDEAFKSRILLSLNYENLNEGQRTQIWKNMFRRLEDIGNKSNNSPGETNDGVATETEPGSRKRKARDEIDSNTVGIDFDEVNCYITELAKHDLNGRQIRNVITTARQLATFRNTKMRYEHLQHVIAVSSKFDSYLKKLQEGYSDD